MTDSSPQPSVRRRRDQDGLPVRGADVTRDEAVFDAPKSVPACGPRFLYIVRPARRRAERSRRYESDDCHGLHRALSLVIIVRDLIDTGHATRERLAPQGS